MWKQKMWQLTQPCHETGQLQMNFCIKLLFSFFAFQFSLWEWKLQIFVTTWSRVWTEPNLRECGAVYLWFCSLPTVAVLVFRCHHNMAPPYLAWWDWSLVLRPYLPSVLWHCWFGHLTPKNPSLIWPLMCLVALNLAQSNPICTSPLTCIGPTRQKHCNVYLPGSHQQLIMSRTWLRKIDDRSFRVTAAWAWNSLPPSVTSAPSLTVFNRQLKTFLLITLFRDYIF